MDGILIAQVLFFMVLANMALGLIAYLILLERKTAAWIQDRLGPNRTGPKGLLQPIADGIKFILKEEFIPKHADRALFLLAPMAIMTPALVGFAVVPWGGVLAKGSSVFGLWSFPENWHVMVSNPDVGVLWVIAMAGLATYGIVLGGWSSGSKFSFLGGLRATAQMLSYEVPMSLGLMTVVVVVGSMNMETLVVDQARYIAHTHGLVPHWNVFTQPVAFLVFVTCIFAEANRTPFDLSECEQELVGGFHTEYSSMKFALFFLAEYASMITGSAVAVGLFLGGWHLPWADHWIYGGAGQPEISGWEGVLLKFGVYWAKVVCFLFFYMWVRWTLPRFRFDQLMRLAWRGMVPLSLGSFLISVVVVYLRDYRGLASASLWLLVANVAFFAVFLTISGMMPKGHGNRRLPVAGSRYNPDLARRAALALKGA